MVAPFDDMADFMEAVSALDWSEPALAGTTRGACTMVAFRPEKTLEAIDALVRFPEV